MIPEAAGATPYGIFLLADSFRDAAHAAVSARRMLTEGPVRLLCYHACELYLKSYMREHGEEVDALRGYGHDLSAMLEGAATRGLAKTRAVRRRLKKAAEANDYVRVRYMVVEKSGDIPAAEFLKLVDDVRECVRLGLGYDEFGNPEAGGPRSR